MEAEVAQAKKDIQINLLLKRIEHAVATGQQYVGIPILDQYNRRKTKLIPTQYFSDESVTPESIASFL